MKYKIIEVLTGKDAGDDLVLTQDGEVACWDDSRGWEVMPNQADFAVVIAEYSSPNLPLEDYAVQAEFQKAFSIRQPQ